MCVAFYVFPRAMNKRAETLLKLAGAAARRRRRTLLSCRVVLF